MTLESRRLKAILRQDFHSFIAKSFATVNPQTPFLPNWHIELIAEYLIACTRREIRRLIINLPPRSLKSLCVSVAWPAWLLGHDPSRRVIAASYANALSVKHSLDCRLVMESDWYRDLFPNLAFAADQNEKTKFMTTARGFRLAASVGGSITGEGGNFLIIDDPHHPEEIFSAKKRQATLDWCDQIFMSRADDKEKSVFILVMQRLHADDLTSHLMGKGGWEQLVLPAMAEKPQHYSFGTVKKECAVGELLHATRESLQSLEQVKRDLGAYAFAAQYQQQPILKTGMLIRPHWLHSYTELPQKPRIIHSWDTAIKTLNHHDYSVGLVWGECQDNHYLIEAKRLHLEYPDLKRAILALAETHPPEAILIEDKASGQSLIQDLRRETHLPIIALAPKQNKQLRMSSVTSFFEAGKIYLPKYSAWKTDYEAELLAFPTGTHDDQVDATSQYLRWVMSRNIAPPSVRNV